MGPVGHVAGTGSAELIQVRGRNDRFARNSALADNVNHFVANHEERMR